MIDHSGLKVIDAHVLQNGHHNLHNKSDQNIGIVPWIMRSVSPVHLWVRPSPSLASPPLQPFSKKYLSETTDQYACCPSVQIFKLSTIRKILQEKIFTNSSGSRKSAYHISFDLTGVLNGSSAEGASEKFPLPRHERQSKARIHTQD